MLCVSLQNNLGHSRDWSRDWNSGNNSSLKSAFVFKWAPDASSTTLVAAAHLHDLPMAADERQSCLSKGRDCSRCQDLKMKKKKKKKVEQFDVARDIWACRTVSSAVLFCLHIYRPRRTTLYFVQELQKLPLPCMQYLVQQTMSWLHISSVQFLQFYWFHSFSNDLNFSTSSNSSSN